MEETNAMPERNRIEPVGAWWLALVVLGSLAAGCATSKQVLEKQVADLEREVVQLKAEKANLSARIGGLDDQLVLYVKRAGRCSEERRTSKLEVVRLSAAEAPAPVAEAADEERLPAVEDGGKRPVLKIVGSGSYSPAASRSTTRGVLPTGLGDNLGVVSMDGAGGEAASGGVMEQFQQAYRAFTNKSLDEALVRFAKFVKDNPGHQYADNAMFWRGESYLAKGKLLKAIGEFERLMRRYPSSEKRPSALYRIGFAYDKLGDLGRAKEYYFKVVDRHPGTDAARRASRRMATLQEAGGRSAKLLPASAKR
jgi:tol-pal system protein YbgF